MALDLTGIFEEEKEEDKKDTIQSSSSLSVTPTTSQKTTGLNLSGIFDDDEGVETVIEEKPESAEERYLRTGEVPEGFKYVPTVPTGDAPEDRVKFEPVDAPDVSQQTEKAFDYQATSEVMSNIFGDEGIPGITAGASDFLGIKEASQEYVPEVLQPLSNILAQTSNDILGLLLSGAVAAGETVTDSAEVFTRAVHETFDEDNKIMGMTGKELIPFSPETSGKKFGRDIMAMLEVSGVQAPSVTAGTANKLLKKALKETREEADALERFNNRRMRIDIAKNATEENIASKQAAAAEVAAENTALRNELITNFEETTGKTISREVEGVKVIDDEAAREAGRETAKEIQFTERQTMRGDVLTGGKDVEVAGDDTSKLLFEMQTADADGLISPILKAEKLDSLVAATAELKERVPRAFEPKFFTNIDGTRGKEYGVIDHLLDLTVDEKLLPGDELIDILNKYNLSFEDYILAVVGSGSEAGRVLNRLSQIKRSRPINEMQKLQREATEAQQGAIRNTAMRIEGIRRGGLVSQIATAARNLTSAGIRAPLDSVANLMDTALYNVGRAEGVKGKAIAGFKSMADKENWNGSFANMRYMFGPDAKIDAAEYVDFILERPELSKQFDLMFNQLNELQQATGRGLPRQKQIDKYIATAKAQAKKDGVRLNKRQLQKDAEEYADRGILGIQFGKKYTKNFNTLGRAGDTILSELEDAVSVLNTANRWQEYLIRRGSFLGELERLTKREYNIDLIDALNDGKLPDLLNDASSVRPKDARSFKDLVADATNKALDVTYAKQPENQTFREITSFITRNGLTVAIPFPRFMFNSLELMGNYAGGMSIPLTKKIIGQYPKGTALTAKDRQRIARNLVGIAAVGAAYYTRSDPDAPADYKELPVGDGTVLDTTPQFPMRQVLWIGEAMKQLREGTFFDWYNTREAAETFLGTNIRVGVGNSIVDEVVALAGEGDLTKDEAAGRRWGRLIGNYLSTWAVPYAQIIDTERALGMRSETERETAYDPEKEKYEDPVLDEGISFNQNLRRALKRYTLTPEEEAKLPKRERLFQEEASRVGTGLKVIAGLSMRTRDSEAGEYIKRLGLSEFELGSTSKVPSIRSFENSYLREIIPGIVDAAKEYEEELREEYQNSKALQDEMTEKKYVNSMIRPLIEVQIKDAKRQLTDGERINPNADEYVAAMIAYRRLPASIRKSAAAAFIKREGRPADGANEDDLALLAELGRARLSAYKD